MEHVTPVAVEVEHAGLVEAIEQETAHPAHDRSREERAVGHQGDQALARGARVVQQLPDRPTQEAQVFIVERPDVPLAQRPAVEAGEVGHQVGEVLAVVGRDRVGRVAKDQKAGVDRDRVLLA
jgi:hypothetical protein